MKMFRKIKLFFKKKVKMSIPRGATNEEVYTMYHKILDETGVKPIVVGNKETMKILGTDVAKKQ